MGTPSKARQSEDGFSSSGVSAPAGRTDSLGKRYLFKLVSNAATIPLFFVLEAVLPRALGPAGYGNFNFATNLFQQFTSFLDMGSSTCLATTLSKRPGEFALLAFYVRISAAMLLLCLAAALGMYIPGAGGLFMPGVPLGLALPAALWAYLTWAGRIARGMNDSLGITARSEMVRITVNLVSMLALLGLFFTGALSMPVFFAHQYVFLGAACVGFILVLRGAFAAPYSFRLEKGAGKAYIREFWAYSAPLFLIALCSALALCGERWMLQFFNGSVEQGYFSLSQKVGMACFLFVTAMTPLLMRELAVAHGNKDTAAMGRLLDKFAPMLYAAAAWFCCFTLVEGETVVRIFGGAAFGDALAPLRVMALYPMHQAYGQISASVYYASGETRALRNITLWSLVAGLACSWVLLAPPSLMGLELGAVGLAVKMTAVQFISVNILLLACRKMIPFNYERNLAHQLVCPMILTGLAFIARFATEAAGLDAGGLWRFLCSGVLYGLFTLAAVCVFPWFMGVTRAELRSQARRLLRRGT